MYLNWYVPLFSQTFLCQHVCFYTYLVYFVSHSAGDPFFNIIGVDKRLSYPWIAEGMGDRARECGEVRNELSRQPMGVWRQKAAKRGKMKKKGNKYTIS